jgi:cell division protein FtsB
LILIIMVVLVVLLQVRLWSGNGGLAEIWTLQQALEQQKKENIALRERNEALEAEVRDLKQGSAAIEERARSELGMTKEGEIFFQAVEE